MNARLKAFQHQFVENRKPKFELESHNKSILPNRKHRKANLDSTFNTKIDKPYQNLKMGEVPHVDDFSGGLDSVVRKILKAPASEQRLSPLEKVI